MSGMIWRALSWLFLRGRFWATWISIVVMAFGIGVLRGRKAAELSITLGRADQKIAALKARQAVSNEVSQQASDEGRRRLKAWSWETKR
jgi:uncharacterized membrane protein YraQ (UPF0718 family)